MRKEKFYKQRKGFKGFRGQSMLLMAILLLFVTPTFSQVIDSPPTFVNGNPINFSMCQGYMEDISDILSISDADLGQTETWSVIMAPSNGSLAGFDFFGISNGGVVTPSGLTYTPSGTYAGIDSFTIQINDGAGDSTTTTLYVTINPTPYFTVPISQSVCNGLPSTGINLTDTVSGATFTWSNTDSSIGLAYSGSGASIGSFTVVDTSMVNSVMATITIIDSANGCAGMPQSFTITANPVPNAGTTPNLVFCNGSIDSVSFNGIIAGTNYSWAGTTSVTGIPLFGIGNIAPFTATNTSTVAILDTIMVTPSTATCTGSIQEFTISVNPTPSMTSTIEATTPCTGFPYKVIFNAPVDGAYFNWTNNNVALTSGLGSSGTSDSISFNGNNTTVFPLNDTIIVVPYVNSCAGAADTISLTINPNPVLNTVTDTSICDSNLFHLVLTSATPGFSIDSWTPDVVTGVFIHSSGSADTINDVMDDTLTSNGYVDYVVNLSANGCNNIDHIQVHVNPTLSITNWIATPTLCDSTLFTYVPTLSTDSVIFMWNRNLIPGISNSSNVGSDSIKVSDHEYLNDTIDYPVTVPYFVHLSRLGSGCAYTQTLTVVVNPILKLSNTILPTSICNNTQFYFIDSNYVSGVTNYWHRDSIAGNSFNSGIDSVNEILANSTNSPVNVLYIDTLKLGQCSNVATVSVIVNPNPVLLSTLNPSPVCDNSTFTYLDTANTGSTTAYGWSRAAVAGITPATGTGTGVINESLVNSTDSQVAVTYVDTLKINGCWNTQNIVLLVNPNPVLSSSLTPAAICDSAIFNYTPTSTTSAHTAVTYSWVRPYVMGIGLPAASGTGPLSEQTINTTNFNVTDTYQYTIMAYGCSNQETVTVVVSPTPLLNTSLSESVCSGSPFYYNPSSYTPGVSFNWSRAAVAGISNASGSGTNNIGETLNDSVNYPVTAVYVYTITVGAGCTHKEYLDLLVNPTPGAGEISIYPPSYLCSGTYFQNFGAASAPGAGVNYTWSASNAFIWAEGENKQNCLVSFSHPGTAVISLNTTSGTTRCTSNSTYTVYVGTAISDDPVVIYYRGQFICLAGNEDNYQWGYDDATTLDSTAISGEINASYFNSNPDFAHLYYWVMTKKGDCIQKSYYNAPLAITNVNQGSGVDMKVYPNPASSNINVQINADVTGDVQLEIVNIVGQKVAGEPMNGHNVNIDVNGLPAGCYLISCYRDGVKIANSKFVKN